MNGDNVTYFDSFRVEHIQKEIKKFTGNKNISTIIFRIQTNDLMCEYFCVGFIYLFILRSFFNFFKFTHKKNIYNIQNIQYMKQTQYHCLKLSHRRIRQ